jgi:ATP-dependent exoDNAse (exonuclease V) beta subunit
VVWWDPAALGLGAEPSFGVRQAELMSKEADPELVAEDAERHRSWESARRRLLAEAAVPTLEVRTATDWAAAGGELPEVELIEMPRAKKRPSGPRFGSLVHAALASVPLDADAPRIRQVVELEARILGASDEEAKAAAKVVRGVLEHPVLQRSRRAVERGECRRETPVTRRLDGTLVEGVVDLAFRENGAWTVVDFKTDREMDAGLDIYRRQVGLYAAIVAEATEEAATAVLMRI